MATALEKILAEAEARIKAGTDRVLSPDDPASGPRELHFELTYSCNQKCVMCDIWPRYRRQPALQRQELSREEIQKLVEGSALLRNIELILFSGGEPFLRNDLVPLVRFFAAAYPSARIGILSNCFAGDRILKALGEIMEAVPPGRIMLGTSLDGVGESHDRIRDTPGSFSRLNTTLKQIRDRFPGISLEANFTITPQNFPQLMPAYRFARGLRVGFTAQFPIPWKGTPEFNWEGKNWKRVEEEIHALMGRIYRDEKDRFMVNRDLLLIRLYYWKGLLDYQRQPRRIFPYCPAVARYAMFSPQGDLYFCPKLKNMTVGNIREAPFDRLWLGERASAVRKYIQSGACHCWLNCTTYINISQALERTRPLPRRLVTRFARGIAHRRGIFSTRCRSRLRAARQALLNLLVFPYLLFRVGGFYLRRVLRSRRPRMTDNQDVG